MIYIFFIILSIMVVPFSESQIKPKLCIDCKFYKKDLFNSKFGKCSLFTLNYDQDYFLVDGNTGKKDYLFCSIARKYDHMCGEKAKFYEKKYTKRLK